jgi:poly(A) polymerase
MQPTVRMVAVEKLIYHLRKAGKEAYLIGGCVRDRILANLPKDYDIVTNAVPDEVMAIFPDCSKPVGAKFGVVLVTINEESFEVATFRAEDAYSDHRHPDAVVYSKTLAEDVQRRDFTINALALDIETGELVDLTGGVMDIAHKKIRCIGDPNRRFEEDALRLLRAIRFAARLDFQIDEPTWGAMRVNAPLLAEISGERKREELIAMLSQPRAVRALELLLLSNLLDYLLPELDTDFGRVLRRLNQMPAISWSSAYGQAVKDHVLIALSLLFLDLGTTARKNALLGLKFSTADAAQITNIITKAQVWSCIPDWNLAAQRRYRRDADYDLIRQVALHDYFARPAYTGGQRAFHRVDQFMSAAGLPGTYPKVLLNGDDLIALGYKPSPAFGFVLHNLEDEQLEEKIKTREEAVAFVTTQLRNSPMAVS